MQGLVLLLLAVTPPRQPGFSASLPPAPAAPPALGTKEADGAASCKAGRPCAPPPGRSSRSCYPFPPPHPEGTDRDPRGRRGETPPATSSHRKALPRPDLDPQPLQGAAESDTGPEAAGCLSPDGAHQNSRDQMFTSCIVLGFSSGDTGRILLACGVGASAGHMQV